MSAKRRDKKNGILHSGESQTKDGCYQSTFYEGGKQRAFYSWKLEPTDRLPAGRRDCVALRDQIADYKQQHANQRDRGNLLCGVADEAGEGGGFRAEL